FAGAMALFFYLYSFSYNISPIGMRLLTNKGRIISFIVSFLLMLFVVTSIETMVTKRITQNQIDKNETLPNNILNEPTHSISVIIDNPPTSIRAGESVLINILFRIKKYNLYETGN